MSSVLEALSCTGRNPLSLWTTQGSVSRVYDNTSRCYVLVISNDQRRSSIERSFGPFYRYALVQVRSQDAREFSIDLSIEALHSRRLRLCISTAFRVPSVNDVHVQVPLGLGHSRPGWLSLLIDSELLVNSAFSGKIKSQGISSIRINGCCAARKVLLLREPVQVDHDFSGRPESVPAFPMHPSHEFPPGVKRLSVRLGFSPNRVEAPQHPFPSPSVQPTTLRPSTTPRLTGNQVPSLPLARVSAAVARRSSAQAVEDIKHTARLLFDQLTPGRAKPISPATTSALPPLRRSPSTSALPSARTPVISESPRPRSVREQINEAFDELMEMKKLPSSVASQPATPGKMLLKVGELLYDPENDRYYNSQNVVGSRLDLPQQ